MRVLRLLCPQVHIILPKMQSLWLINSENKVLFCRKWCDSECPSLDQLIKVLPADTSSSSHFTTIGNSALILKRFASVLFILLVVPSENEFKYLAFVDLFVKTLDRYFGGLTVSHLTFNFQKVHLILDTMTLGGRPVSTHTEQVLQDVTDFERQGTMVL